jgi:biopolymer transport protein TolQ
MITPFFLKGNPFFDAYIESDLLGKAIFASLIFLSIVSWSILFHKIWLANKAKKYSLQFRKLFFDSKTSPLLCEYTPRDIPNPFGIIHEIVRSKAKEVLEKNRKEQQGTSQDFLSTADMALLDTHAAAAISSLTKYLEKNLYILSTIVTLAPFLGLLGTVYGILTTFTHLQTSAASTNQVMLGGISLALCTTVIGLIDAIPALLGYNYTKNLIYDFQSDMQQFATDVLSAFELQYRKP